MDRILLQITAENVPLRFTASPYRRGFRACMRCAPLWQRHVRRFQSRHAQARPGPRLRRKRLLSGPGIPLRRRLPLRTRPNLHRWKRWRSGHDAASARPVAPPALGRFLAPPMPAESSNPIASIRGRCRLRARWSAPQLCLLRNPRSLPETIRGGCSSPASRGSLHATITLRLQTNGVAFQTNRHAWHFYDCARH